MQTELRHFVSLVQAGSITAAASQLGMTQPALSKSLKRLEEHLGLNLVTRHSRGIILTDAGQRIYKRASAIEAEMRYLELEASSEKLKRQKTLRIGAGPLWSVVFLPGIVERFRRHFPDVALSIRVDPRHALLGLLADGAIDIAICATDGQSPDDSLLRETLMDIDLGVACGSTHPLIDNWTGDPAQLLDYDWVIYQSDPDRPNLSRDLTKLSTFGAPRSIISTSSWLGGLLMTAHGHYLINLPMILKEFVEPFGIRYLAHASNVSSFPGGVWCRPTVATTEVGKRFRSIAREEIVAGADGRRRTSVS